MAITKSTELYQTEAKGKYKIINVFSYQVIKEDGTEISRSKEMVNTLTPGTLDGSDNLVDTDISGQDASVQAICNALWTDSVKTAYKNYLIANK